MNFPKYKTTALEDLVTQWYIRHRFTRPEDLNIKKIGLKYEIFLHCKPKQASFMKVGRFKEIVVDSRLPMNYQREQFFHELCHAVRHTGRQSMMPTAFRELQERDAKHFTLYSSLPFHMIQQYNITDPEIINKWSTDFRIPIHLCKDRLDQIKRRHICTS